MSVARHRGLASEGGARQRQAALGKRARGVRRRLSSPRAACACRPSARPKRSCRMPRPEADASPDGRVHAPLPRGQALLRRWRRRSPPSAQSRVLRPVAQGAPRPESWIARRPPSSSTPAPTSAAPPTVLPGRHRRLLRHGQRRHRGRVQARYLRGVPDGAFAEAAHRDPGQHVADQLASSGHGCRRAQHWPQRRSLTCLAPTTLCSFDRTAQASGCFEFESDRANRGDLPPFW